MTSKIGTRFGLHKQLDFLVLLVSWFVFASLFQTRKTMPGLFPAWALLTSLVSMMMLGAFEYFDRHIPKPELSGVMSLLIALPLSAIFAKWTILVVTQLPLIRYTEALRASVWVALTFELSQLAIFKIHRMMGRKWSLVTHLRPEELEELNTQIQQSGSSWWITTRPYEPFNTNGGRLRSDETLVISRQAAHELKNCTELLTAHLQGQRIVDVRQLLKEFGGRVSLQNSDGWSFLLGSTYQSFFIRFYFHLKEIFEGLVAFALAIVLLPVYLAVSLGILFTSGSPILYRQKRLGYRGKAFSLYKFRTMPITAEAQGPQWAREDDPRLRGFGRWLRKTRLDELPQLLNVVRGELSFVGPRPERPEFYEILNKEIPLFSTRLLVRPGITGWAQVRQGYAGSVEECKTKLEYDLYYVQHMSPQLDAAVMIDTAALMMKGNSGR